jgi:hypothetical protein
MNLNDNKIVTIVPLTGKYKELMKINTRKKYVWIFTTNEKVIVFDESLFDGTEHIFDTDYYSKRIWLMYREQKANYDSLDDNVKTIVKEFLS